MIIKFPSPTVPCFQLAVFGVYSIILFLLSLIFNILLMTAVFKTKHLHEARYYFLACLSILNLFGTLVELPILISSAFNCGLGINKNHVLII